MIALVLAQTAWGCESMRAALTRAEDALADAEADLAQLAIDQAREAFTRCSDPVAPSLLGRVWLIQGIAVQLSGQDPTLHYQAAHRADPSAWDPLFGPSIKEAYDQAVATPTDDARLVLVPPDPRPFHLNGRLRQEAFLDIEAGLHAVQVLPGHASWHQVEPGAVMTVDHGQPLQPRTQDEPRPPREKRDKPLPLLLAGTAGAAVGAGLLAWSVERGAALKSSEDWPTLKRRYRQHSAARVGGIGLLAAGGATLGLYGVW